MDYSNLYFKDARLSYSYQIMKMSTKLFSIKPKHSSSGASPPDELPPHLWEQSRVFLPHLKIKLTLLFAPQLQLVVLECVRLVQGPES